MRGRMPHVTKEAPKMTMDAQHGRCDEQGR